MARASACSLTCEVASWHGEHRRGRERWPIGFDGRRHVVRQGVCGLRPGSAPVRRARAPLPRTPLGARAGEGRRSRGWRRILGLRRCACARARARRGARGGGGARRRLAAGVWQCVRALKSHRRRCGQRRPRARSGRCPRRAWGSAPRRLSSACPARRASLATTARPALADEMNP